MDMDNNYGFYSKVLKKPFDTLEELEQAEKEYNEIHAVEIKAAEEKKNLAHEVEESYKNYLNVYAQCNEEFKDVQKKLNEQVAKAKNEYTDLKNEFIKKYGSFHMTYKDEEPKVEISEDNLDDEFILNVLRRLWLW